MYVYSAYTNRIFPTESNSHHDDANILRGRRAMNMEVQGRVKRRVKMVGYNEGRYQREWTVEEDV